MMWPPKSSKKQEEYEEKANPLIGKYDDFYANAKVYDQKFGLLLTVDNLRQPAKMSLSYGPDNFYPWRPFAAPDTTLKKKKEKEELLANYFAIHMDVQHFKPPEIQIKVTGRQCNVKASHGDRKDDHGSVARRFEREFTLPSDIDVETVKSVISSDGVLTFKAQRTTPRKKKLADSLGAMIVSSEQSIDESSTSEESLGQNSSPDVDIGTEIPIEFIKPDETIIVNETTTSQHERSNADETKRTDTSNIDANKNNIDGTTSRDE